MKQEEQKKNLYMYTYVYTKPFTKKFNNVVKKTLNKKSELP